MLEGLLGRKPFIRVHLEQLINKLHSFKAQILPKRFQIPNHIPGIVNIRHDGVVILQLLHPRPVRFIRCPTHLRYQTKLLGFLIPRKGRLPYQHLIKDTPNGPGVDFLSIFLLAKQQFRGSIPQSHYSLGEMVVENFRQSKVSNFDFSFIAVEDIGWFQISVDYFLGVEVLQSFKDLLYCAFDLGF